MFITVLITSMLFRKGFNSTLNQRMLLFIIVFLCTLISNIGMAFDKRKVCYLVKEAENIYNNDSNESSLMKGESLLLKAISLAPNVDRLECYREEVIIFEYKKFKIFHEGREYDYHPHKLLKQIKMKIPPKPWAKASLLKKEIGTLISVEILNKGKSTMENILVSLSIETMKTLPQKILRIKPGKKGVVEWLIKDNILDNSFNINFKEQYGFSPCSLQF